MGDLSQTARIVQVSVVPLPQGLAIEAPPLILRHHRVSLSAGETRVGRLSWV